MAFGYGNSVDLVAAVLRNRPVSETPESTSEAAMLVEKARNGDRTAFGHLYNHYAPMVHGVLLARIPVGAVDDLVQDVFVLALRRLATLREAGSFGAWLAAIARNLANDHYRRSTPEEQLADDAPDAEIKCGTVSADDEGSAAAILKAVRNLPDAYRETLILRLVEGMTGPEIAAQTGLSHGSVRVNLHRGMQQLRTKLNANVRLGRAQQETQ